MKTAVLLLNLGTPDSPKVSSVRKYLKQFLSDPRVIDLPTVLRNILLYCVILPFRPKQSAEAYQEIWTEEGSPLKIYTERCAHLLQEQVGDSYIVDWAMRYANPSVDSVVTKVLAQEPERILVLPLFPQYSSAASGSAIEEFMQVIKSKAALPNIEVISDFYDHPEFIKAQAAVIKQELEGFDFDKLLFSYHGLPVRQVQKTDSKAISCDQVAPCPAVCSGNRFCYRAQCYGTTNALVAELGLSEEQHVTAFQSRLGRIPWIKPYTDELLNDLYEQGVRNLAVACPSFVADCLETIEEIGIRLQADWTKLGGKEFKLIPCLNDRPEWISAMQGILLNSR